MVEEHYEEKKKKKGLLPLILVLTLILVVSVGGVYAYFAARATNSGQTITGQTLDINGATLSISAQRVNLNPSPTPVSDDLVPANFGVSPSDMTTTEVNRALDGACAGGGYTGCHVWKITASTTESVPSANIKLNLRVVGITEAEAQPPGDQAMFNAYNPSDTMASPLDYSGNNEYKAKLLAVVPLTITNDKSQWSYIVYTGTDSSATTILNKGSIITTFPDNNTTIDIHSGAGLIANTPTVYYIMIYLNNVSSVQNGVIVDGDANNARGTYNGTVTLEAMGGEVKVNFIDTAADYITNLYTNATKSTATVNNITYNLAPSVGLMNDRHASMSTGADAGDIRYYGANPNNYVWLGDTYTTDYTIPGNVTLEGYADQEACIQDGNSESYCTEDIVRHAGDKKLWRVIGVFDGRVKLVTADPISTQGLSWDTSANAAGGNSGWGINQWGPSGSYEGADLMRLLNPGYEGTSINNSLYWNKGTGTVYTGDNNGTTANISFANTGLSASEKALIDTATWYTGAYDSVSYVDSHYTAERGNIGKICTQGTTWCDDEVTRTSSWSGKVGLIYASDYGYAVNLAQCNQIMDNYWEDGCWNNNWLKPSLWGNWTMSPFARFSDAYFVFRVAIEGGFYGNSAYLVGWVWPAVYLKSGVTISSGNGSESQPFVIQG